MQYQEALAYLYDKLPVFHRIGAKAIKPGLANIEKLCAALEQPHTRFKTIHVAGTNGKGSTSHMLAAIYQAAGYRVGLYTSPHLKSFTERIRINGQPIPDEEVAQFVTTFQALIEAVNPSFFEVTVAMAFDYFARKEVDLAIIEVGLGGRLDSTNILQPLLSVITNIGWDHMDLLGDTLDKIATEKAGIIKPQIPVIIGERQPETTAVFLKKAEEEQAPIYFAQDSFLCIDKGILTGKRQVEVLYQSLNSESLIALMLTIDLLGQYQLLNLPAVLQSVFLLQQFPVSTEQLQNGLASVTRLTGLKGRWQVLRKNPYVVADTAHNKPGFESLLAMIPTIQHRQLHLVIGFVQDKDVESVLALLPTSAKYYLCQANTPRALAVHDLFIKAVAAGLQGQVYPDVNAALASAVAEASAEDLVVVTGSTYVVAELQAL
ncbi:folylpolyglutamate synthase/dihydrofolate synthase family protein [Nibrella viscosa]|uniref:Dihydrofolate synthase/folylpolyglutamate synthase n=1 Tax=Nibrella viscosa TaxID=1084524 RepID=A0ABP8KL14_9BACT